jgi:hypothetical protein
MKDRGSVTLVNSALNATLVCAVQSWAVSGTQVVCDVPEGAGSGWVVTISARQTRGSSLSTLAFEGPVVTQVAPDHLESPGGAVTLTGRNFGSPQRGYATGAPTVMVQVCVWTGADEPDVV